MASIETEPTSEMLIDTAMPHLGSRRPAAVER
jgi:hypothetical protein